MISHTSFPLPPKRRSSDGVDSGGTTEFPKGPPLQSKAHRRIISPQTSREVVHLGKTNRLRWREMDKQRPEFRPSRHREPFANQHKLVEDPGWKDPPRDRADSTPEEKRCTKTGRYPKDEQKRSNSLAKRADGRRHYHHSNRIKTAHGGRTRGGAV